LDEISVLGADAAELTSAIRPFYTLVCLGILILPGYGGGGSGDTSSGTIDGCGSIFVNGVGFDTNQAEITLDGTTVGNSPFSRPIGREEPDGDVLQPLRDSLIANDKITLLGVTLSTTRDEFESECNVLVTEFGFFGSRS
jgi:hypothetical protein